MKKRMEDMVMGDKNWQKANSLAGLFQKIVEDCKVGIFITALLLNREFLLLVRGRVERLCRSTQC